MQTRMVGTTTRWVGHCKRSEKLEQDKSKSPSSWCVRICEPAEPSNELQLMRKVCHYRAFT